MNSICVSFAFHSERAVNVERCLPFWQPGVATDRGVATHSPTPLSRRSAAVSLYGTWPCMMRRGRRDNWRSVTPPGFSQRRGHRPRRRRHLETRRTQGPHPQQPPGELTARVDQTHHPAAQADQPRLGPSDNHRIRSPDTPRGVWCAPWRTTGRRAAGLMPAVRNVGTRPLPQ